MSLDPEVRRHFERAVELITATRARDGGLAAELMQGADVEACAGTAIAAACIARDAFDQLMQARGVDPEAAWSEYALAMQRGFDVDGQ